MAEEELFLLACPAEIMPVIVEAMDVLINLSRISTPELTVNVFEKDNDEKIKVVKHFKEMLITVCKISTKNSPTFAGDSNELNEK